MKKTASALAVLAIMASCGPKGTPQFGRDSISDVIEAMTVEEKVRVLIGTGQTGITSDKDLALDSIITECRNMVPGAAGTTFPVSRLGIPAAVLTDGPAGVRIDAERENDENTYFCTHFPIATLLAATWDQELVEEVGKAIGNEVLEYGADVLLAPALNIHRHPLCGRNFEYFSEDPVVSGKIAAAYIRGVQSNGVGTSIKHFAANNQETNRLSCNSMLSPRTLREIYLKGFEIAVKEADPWTVMSSYNAINGTYASENHELLIGILRDEWGYEGMVMTDWGAGSDAVAQMKASNDMLQPGNDRQFKAIMEALNNGTLDEAVIDRNVRRVLEMIQKTPAFRKYENSDKPDLTAHARITRQSATEGMVLLKNEDATLPFDKDINTLAVFGSVSYDFYAGGTGSGNVVRAYTVSLLDGLNNVGYKTEPSIHEAYSKHVAAEIERLKPEKETAYSALMPREQVREMNVSLRQIRKSADASDAALITIGRPSGEFADRKSSEFYVSDEEKELIGNVSRIFHEKGKKVVVVLNIGGVIETASWKDQVDAIICAWQAGQEGGNSVADALSGRANPSGKLPMTFPVDMTDHLSHANFPVDQNMPLSFSQDTSGRKDRKNIDYVMYEEGIYVGYRYFQTEGVPVSYPFGYGMSYTTFEYSEPVVKAVADGFAASVTIRNTGSAAGKEAVQLYVTAPAGGLEKPALELKGFAKTRELAPGEAQTLTINVSDYDITSFNEETSAWEAAAGTYKVMFGANAADIRGTAEYKLKKAESWKVNNVLAPAQPLKELSLQK